MKSSASDGRLASAVLDPRRWWALPLLCGEFSWIVPGGVLVSADLSGSTWRPVFLVNVPVGLAVTAPVPRVLPADVPGRVGHPDLPGLAVAVPASWQ